LNKLNYPELNTQKNKNYTLVIFPNQTPLAGREDSKSRSEKATLDGGQIRFGGNKQLCYQKRRSARQNYVVSVSDVDSRIALVDRKV
jgi:hypothetical protein